MKPFSLRGQTARASSRKHRTPRHRRHARERHGQARLVGQGIARLAFALVLAGTLAIGVISLTQISRLNGVDRIDLHARLRREPRGRGNARLSAAREPLAEDAADRDHREGARRTRRADRAGARRTSAANRRSCSSTSITSDEDALAQQKSFATAVTKWSEQPAHLRQAREGAAARSVADELAGRHAGRVAAGRNGQARKDRRRSRRASRRRGQGDDRCRRVHLSLVVRDGRSR